MEKYKYEINGKTYVLKKLVWGQMEQLIDLLKTIRVPAGAGTAELILAFGGKFTLALAIVLTEEGTSVKDKDLEKIAKELKFEVELELGMQVVDDFFVLNPIALLWEKLQDMMLAGQTKMKAMELKRSSPSSAAEI
jgi:hypothetical protein